MRVHILSDLHIEVMPFRASHTDADVVILAGDIDRHWWAIDWAKSHALGDKMVIYVPGNHEYYGISMSRAAIELCARAAETRHIKVLDNDEIVVGNVRFLGATLWTDFELDGIQKRTSAMAEAAACIWDFHSIIYGSTGYLTPPQTVTLHRQSKAWLQRKLDERFNGTTVVVTHHAPHPKSVHKRFANNPLNPAFVSNLEDMMGVAKLWVHGHTHDSFDYTVRGTRVVCNPRGYARRHRDACGDVVTRGENREFDPLLVVDV